MAFGRVLCSRWVCFFSFCWCLLKIFLIAHFGYLHSPSTCSRCCSSFSANSGVEQMVWALCVSVLITLYLAAMLWLLSHGRYSSVWVSFLYTPYCEGSICFWSDDGIQEGYWAIFLCLLYSKLDRWIYFPTQTRRSSHVWLQKLVNLRI